MSTWLQLLLQLLCQIYQELGGDCKDLYNDIPDAPSTVCDAYDTNGAPKFTDQKDKAAFLGTLTSLQTQLASPNNTLPSSDTANLTAMISGLRKDLGA
jgi:hypothetical protein